MHMCNLCQILPILPFSFGGNLGKWFSFDDYVTCTLEESTKKLQRSWGPFRWKGEEAAPGGANFETSIFYERQIETTNGGKWTNLQLMKILDSDKVFIWCITNSRNSCNITFLQDFFSSNTCLMTYRFAQIIQKRLLFHFNWGSQLFIKN